MENKLTVLLVEDDEQACRDITQCFDEFADIDLVGITNDSLKAVKLVLERLPHAVILDLELHQGSGNGLLFLNELNQQNLSAYPYILVTTNNSSMITYEYARQAGADFIMAKYQSGYSAKKILEFLQMIKSTILSKNGCKEPGHNTIESTKQKADRIAREINVELDHLGISPKAVGRKYLIDSIELIIEKPVSNMCSVVGERYGKTYSSVERAMQNAINRAWRTSDIDDLTKHYRAKISSDKGVPTLTEFVYYYANRIKNRY